MQRHKRGVEEKLIVAATRSILIEDHGSGTSLQQNLKRQRLAVIPIKPKRDKVMRMHAHTASLEATKVFLPKGAPWLDEFRGEILAFPHGRHDDQVDALSQLKFGGFRVAITVGRGRCRQPSRVDHRLPLSCSLVHDAKKSPRGTCFGDPLDTQDRKPSECVPPECLIDAIHSDTEPALEKWPELNRECALKWPNITVKKDMLDDTRAH